jgi:hypothetical protein
MSLRESELDERLPLRRALRLEQLQGIRFKRAGPQARVFQKREAAIRTGIITFGKIRKSIQMTKIGELARISPPLRRDEVRHQRIARPA